MKRAALYARVSTDAQEKEGTIKSQVEEVRRQIKAAGDIITKEYLDDGYSGKYIDRPALNELRADLKRNLFDAIYILQIDRLSRDLTNLKIVISDIFIYKKQLIVNGRDCMDDPEHKFELTILGAVAEFEREKILERNTRGRMYRLRQGQLMPNGKRIFGYSYFPKSNTSPAHLEINEHEAKIVRKIFELYAKSNTSFKAISNHLREAGLIDERVSLKGHRVGYILGNEAYAGTKYFNTMETKQVDQGLGQRKKRVSVYRDRSEWIGIPVPAIVSKELFDKVQERIRYNRECFRNAKGTQLLSNLVFCSICKERCHGFRKFYAVKSSRKMTYYDRRLFNCRKGRCGNSMIDARLLESLVREMILETLVDPAKLKTRLEFLKHKRRGTHRIEKEVDDLTGKLQRLGAQKARIVDLYANNGIEQEEYSRRITNYADQISKLEAARKQLLQQLPLFAEPKLIERSVTEYSKNVKERFETCANFDEWRQFFLNFVEKVEYDRSHKTLTRVSLRSSIPVRLLLPDGEEEIKIGFTVKHTAQAEEIERKLREFDLADGSIKEEAISITRVAYVLAAQTTI